MPFHFWDRQQPREFVYTPKYRLQIRKYVANRYKIRKFGVMDTKTDIEFEQLVQLAKRLPKKQWARLKLEVENPVSETFSDLESFLLAAPIFTDKQLEDISMTRNLMKQWRNK